MSLATYLRNSPCQAGAHFHVCTKYLAPLFAALSFIDPPRRAHAQSLIIRNATVIDGTSATPRRGLDICIVNGRIARVAPRCTLAVTAPVIDASGLYITPGFVDMHVHLLEHGRDEKGNIPPQIDWDLTRRSMRLLLEHGVTMVRDPGSETETAVK